MRADGLGSHTCFRGSKKSLEAAAVLGSRHNLPVGMEDGFCSSACSASCIAYTPLLEILDLSKVPFNHNHHPFFHYTGF